MTILFVAHRPSSVKNCDRLLYLEHGRIAAEGTFDRLRDTVPGFARLVALATVDRIGGGGTKQLPQRRAR